MIQIFVLEAITDDYEDFERISKEATALGARCGIVVSDEEILGALRDLIEAGMANAYLLEPTSDPPKPSANVPRDDQMGDYYFWITEKGRARHLAADMEWPFNEDGTLKQNWTLSQ